SLGAQPVDERGELVPFFVPVDAGPGFLDDRPEIPFENERAFTVRLFFRVGDREGMPEPILPRLGADFLRPALFDDEPIPVSLLLPLTSGIFATLAMSTS